MSNARYLSPLRYPGGKARMSTYLGDLFTHQSGLMDIEVWVEPFAGGLGAGLHLLHKEVVSEVWFCEKNPALAAMWNELIRDPLDFADRVSRLAPSLNLYYDCVARVAASYEGDTTDQHGLGVAAFVVNRCSRSGIVAPRVGPVGGKHQSGKWTIADRFHPDRLAERIRYIAPLTRRMRYQGDDALRSLADLDGSVGIEDEMVIFADPPYIREGNGLYANGFTAAHHQQLADALGATPARWVLTYDDEPDVHQRFYPHQRVLEFDIPHTANKQRIDREYLVFSDNVAVNPDMGVFPRGSTRWLRWDGLDGIDGLDQEVAG